MSEEVSSDSGWPPAWLSASHPLEEGPHLAFMPYTVIQISIGTVHGPMTHGNDPWPDSPVLISFLEKGAQSEGHKSGERMGVRFRIKETSTHITWRSLSSQ